MAVLLAVRLPTTTTQTMAATKIPAPRGSRLVRRRRGPCPDACPGPSLLLLLLLHASSVTSWQRDVAALLQLPCLLHKDLDLRVDLPLPVPVPVPVRDLPRERDRERPERDRDVMDCIDGIDGITRSMLLLVDEDPPTPPSCSSSARSSKRRSMETDCVKADSDDDDDDAALEQCDSVIDADADIDPSSCIPVPVPVPVHECCCEDEASASDGDREESPPRRERAVVDRPLMAGIQFQLATSNL